MQLSLHTAQAFHNPFSVGQQFTFLWHKEEEIDIVALNQDTKDILFVECKWKYLDKRDAGRVLAKLEKKSGSVQWNNDSRQEYYGLVAKNIEGKERLRENRYVVFDLDDM